MVAALKQIEQTQKVIIYCPPEKDHYPFATWMADHIKSFEPAGVIPVVVYYEGEIAAMVGYSRPHYNRIEVSWASVTAKWSTRTNLLAVMSPPFVKWGFEGITAVTAKKNRRLRGILERMGWKREGALRRAGENGENVLIYGLLRGEYLTLVKKWRPDMYDDTKSLIEEAANGEKRRWSQH